MAIQLDFKGRKDVLSRLFSSLENTGKTTFLIQAPGGLGKSRLIQEFRIRWDTWSEYLLRKEESIFLNIIDISAFSHFEFSLEDQIADDIDEITKNNYFEPYKNNKKKYTEHLINPDNDIEIVKRIRKETIDSFVICFNEVSKLKKIILSLDTIDKPFLDRTSFIDFIENTYPLMMNITLILTGREAFTIKYDGAISIALDSFLPEITAELLKELPENEFKYRFIFLSEGKPLIIGLIKTWLDEKVDLPNIVKFGEEQWAKKLKDKASLIKEFEMELMDPFLTMGLDYSELFQEMAVFEKRYNAEILYYLHKNKSVIKTITEDTPINTIEDAKLVIEGLQRFFFVKSISYNLNILQDEVKRLINQNIINKIGHDNSFRNDLLSRIIPCYEEILKVKNEKLIEIVTPNNLDTLEKKTLQREIYTLKAEKYFYEIQLDSHKVIELAEVFDNAIHDGNIDLEQALQSLLFDIFKDIQDQSIKVKVSTSKAKHHRKKSEYEQAIILYKEIIEYYKQLKAKTPETENELIFHQVLYAEVLRDIAKRDEAIKLLKEAELKGINNKSHHLAIVYENLGLNYDDENNIEQAIAYFNLSIESARNSKKQFDHKSDMFYSLNSVLASAYNELGFSLSKKGEYDEAESYCLTGYKLRIRLSNLFRIHLSHSTLGDLYINMSKYSDAKQFLSKALFYFKDTQNIPWQAKTLLKLGKMYRKMYEEKFSKDEDISGILIQAEENLKESKSICEKYDLTKLLPLVLHELGHVHFEKNELDLSRQLWEQSYNQALETKDDLLLINNINGYCDIDLKENGNDAERYNRIISYGDLFPDFDISSNLTKYMGHYSKAKALAHFYLKNEEKAKSKFVEAYIYLSIRKAHDQYNLDKELKALEEILEELDSDKALEWCEYFLEKWKVETKSIERDDIFLLLRNFIYQQIILIEAK